VTDAAFYYVDAQKGDGAPQFILKNVTNFSTHQVTGVADTKVAKTEKKEL
jgi:hypothetical protein